MTSLIDAEQEYCAIRCGLFKCGYGLNNGNGKPCELLMQYLADLVGADA